MKTHAVILDLPFVCRQSSYIEKVNCNWWKIDLRWTTDYLRDVLFLRNPTKPHSRARSHLRAETRSRLASPRYRLSTEFEVPSDDRIRFSGDVAPRCICCSKPKHSWEHECTITNANFLIFLSLVLAVMANSEWLCLMWNGRNINNNPEWI